jgi:hypothetical protein
MKTTTPAQAEHQLTHAADRFDAWRQTRTTRAEPIPQYLWEPDIALTAISSIARVATRLRVSGGELKSAARPITPPSPRPPRPPWALWK